MTVKPQALQLFDGTLSPLCSNFLQLRKPRLTEEKDSDKQKKNCRIKFQSFDGNPYIAPVSPQPFGNCKSVLAAKVIGAHGTRFASELWG